MLFTLEGRSVESTAGACINVLENGKYFVHVSPRGVLSPLHQQAGTGKSVVSLLLKSTSCSVLCYFITPTDDIEMFPSSAHQEAGSVCLDLLMSLSGKNALFQVILCAGPNIQ